MNPVKSNTVSLAVAEDVIARGMYFFWVNWCRKMITNPGQGENILGQQTFANQTKKEKKFTSLKSLSGSLHISRPKTIKRLSKYLSYF